MDMLEQRTPNTKEEGRLEFLVFGDNHRFFGVCLNRVAPLKYWERYQNSSAGQKTLAQVGAGQRKVLRLAGWFCCTYSLGRNNVS